MNEKTLVIASMVGAGFTFVFFVFVLILLFRGDPAPTGPVGGVGDPDQGGEVVREKYVPSGPGFQPSRVKPFRELLLPENDISPEFNQVLDNIYHDYYIVYPCTDSSDGETAVMLTMSDGVGAGSYSVSQITRMFDRWDPQLLNDIGHILFPGADIPEQSLVFRNFSGDEGAVATGIVNDTEREIYKHPHFPNFMIYSGNEACIDAFEYELHPD